MIKLKKAKVIIIVLASIIIFILVSKNPAINKQDSYKFSPKPLSTVKEEVAKPLKTIASKAIGENEYYLKEKKPGEISLYQKTEGADEILYDIPFDERWVKDFWYDKSSYTIFVLEDRNFTGRSRLEQIFKFSLNKQYPEEVLVLKTIPLGVLTAWDRILDYFPLNDTLLLTSQGGENCTNWGSIWTLSGTRVQTLQQLDHGCDDKSRIKFIGYNGKFLYFANLEFTSTPAEALALEKTPPVAVTLKGIYKIDPKIRERTVLTYPNLPDKISNIELSGDNNNIIITTDKGQRFTLGLDQGSKLQEASSSANN